MFVSIQLQPSAPTMNGLNGPLIMFHVPSNISVVKSRSPLT
jgi:hypothetical protein